MLGSAIVYLGLIVAVGGLVLVVVPKRRFRIPTRRRAFAVVGAGMLITGIGLVLPASESRVTRIDTRLDEFAPSWQFREFHTLAVAAPPGRVFDAIKRVRADEILLFHTLIRIRAGGRPMPASIRNAGAHGESLIDVALHTTFVRLAEDAPRELVVGTVVGAPPGARRPLTPEIFQKPLPAGYAVATMNFIVKEDGPGHSLLTTETRVFASSPSARRRFAVYWRVIYPGSALIRRMWLHAIQKRATTLNESCTERRARYLRAARRLAVSSDERDDSSVVAMWRSGRNSRRNQAFRNSTASQSMNLVRASVHEGTAASAKGAWTVALRDRPEAGASGRKHDLAAGIGGGSRPTRSFPKSVERDDLSAVARRDYPRSRVLSQLRYLATGGSQVLAHNS
jgi:hypothetical protein